MGNTPNPDPRLAAQPTQVAPDEPKKAVVEPETVKPVHDPSTIEVEHNDEDPNSPTYRAPSDDETPEV